MGVNRNLVITKVRNEMTFEGRLRELSAAATPGSIEAVSASTYAGGVGRITEWFVRRPEDNVAIAADIVDPATQAPSEVNASRLVLLWNHADSIARLVAAAREYVRVQVEPTFEESVNRHSADEAWNELHAALAELDGVE